MLVKKKNPDWKPSENPELKVGDTIEMTDPRSLIISGDVVGVDSKGVEVSAYELYGVLQKDERQEFEEYLATKKATALKEKLEAEQAELTAQLKKVESEKKVEAPKVEEKKEEVKAPAKKA